MTTMQDFLHRDDRLGAVCKAFAIPERIPASAPEAHGLTRGRQAWLKVGSDSIAYWMFGHGPRVLLVHGWNSRGSHLLVFAEALMAAGLCVILFDAPAHGDSQGEVSSMIHAGRAAVALADHLGDVQSVVAHSAGSTAALWAFSNGLSVEKSVHLCGPVSLPHIVDGTARASGLDHLQTKSFKSWVDTLIGEPLDSVDLPHLRSGLQHQGLIIHDNDDRIVGVDQSQALHAAWPQSRLIVTQGLGHRRILADRATVAATVEFLSPGI